MLYYIYSILYIFYILYIYIESSISIGHIFLELPVRSHRVTMSAALPAGNLDHTWLITPAFNGISRIIELHHHKYSYYHVIWDKWII